MSDSAERAKTLLEGVGDRPWRIVLNRHNNCDGSRWGWIDGPVNHWTWSEEKPLSRAQAEFVVASRSLVPELVAEVERLERRLMAADRVAAEQDLTLYRIAERCTRWGADLRLPQEVSIITATILQMLRESEQRIAAVADQGANKP